MMEKVYGCGELDYTSEPICLREFFKDATLQPHPFLNGPQGLTELTGKRRENAYMDKMSDVMGSNLTDSEFLELENMCSAKNFTVPGAQLFQVDFDHSLNFFNKIDSPSDSTLKTHQSLKSRPRIPERYLKYSGTVWLDESKSSHEKETKLQNIDLVPGCNIVASLRLYAPFRHQMGARSTSRVASGCQEIMVLGTQSLAELRDSFSCTSDNFLCQDVSSNPFVKTKTYAKSKYKSGMMYIENIFYDDHRCPTNLEYSSTVLKWARENHLSLGRKAKMEDTKVLDLTVKLGYPYLYQHQGNCEHLFCFSDVHLLHQSDCLQSSKYPILKSITRQQSRYCMMCGHYVAKWVTVGNNRVPHDPCYFCQTCFLSYNYINKEKIGTFAAYPYLENSPDLFCLRK